MFELFQNNGSIRLDFGKIIILEEFENILKSLLFIKNSVNAPTQVKESYETIL